MKMKYAICVLVSATLQTATVLAQQSGGGLFIDASACVDIVSPVERLACFEARTREAQGAAGGETVAPAQTLPVLNLPTSGARASSPATAAEARTEASIAAPAARDPAADFGLPEKPSTKVEDNELRSSISALRETYPNQHLITLQNGQVWRQMTPGRYQLQVGHSVRIYPTRWGKAYRLTVGELGGHIQVERVK